MQYTSCATNHKSVSAHFGTDTLIVSLCKAPSRFRSSAFCIYGTQFAHLITRVIGTITVTHVAH